uniref:NTR domain-containing protein n=1 Tax=Anguilla anguilla TaxID=7936 RepID=A0A0E9VJL4_ANGAN
MGKTYLIMGKDGTTTDTHGQMQYLLDSSPWVEQLPSESQCQASRKRFQCKDLNTFLPSTRQMAALSEGPQMKP